MPTISAKGTSGYNKKQQVTTPSDGRPTEDNRHVSTIAALEKYIFARRNLYSSINIVRVVKARRMRWAGHVARMGERKGVYRVLVGKPEGKRPLGRTRRKWKDNIKMDFLEMACGGMDWIELAQDRDRWRARVNAVVYFQVP